MTQQTITGGNAIENATSGKTHSLSPTVTKCLLLKNVSYSILKLNEHLQVITK